MNDTASLTTHLVGRTFDGVTLSPDIRELDGDTPGGPALALEFGEGMAFMFKIGKGGELCLSLQWPGGQLPPRGGGDVTPGPDGLIGMARAIDSELRQRVLERIMFDEGEASVVLSFAGGYTLTLSGYEAFALGWPSTADPSMN